MISKIVLLIKGSSILIEEERAGQNGDLVTIVWGKRQLSSLRKMLQTRVNSQVGVLWKPTINLKVLKPTQIVQRKLKTIQSDWAS